MCLVQPAVGPLVLVLVSAGDWGAGCAGGVPVSSNRIGVGVGSGDKVSEV